MQVVFVLFPLRMEIAWGFGWVFSVLVLCRMVSKAATYACKYHFSKFFFMCLLLENVLLSVSINASFEDNGISLLR